MASVASNVVFDDIFTISSIDKEGKKFDRVSRLQAHSKNYDMDMTLDYNIELFPLETGQHFALALASSLARGGQRTNTTDGAAEEEEHVWRPDGKGQRGLEEDYDYVMYGKVYKFDGGTAEINGLRVIRGPPNVINRLVSTYDEHCSRRSHLSLNATVVMHVKSSTHEANGIS
ncbi:uncharacterized protein ARMOST_09346 [Armillaria ostoyae]|uniref:DNA-directed RNA polymerases I, II, and III subunit RPABC3 n=1 Tax=Armillaria ostoyae TaxID=47428 RepID=A0A284RB90_ARMOS|nr:uncharacterized protein ARMOST_09346 [Armillaria ostoyae]